MNLKTISLFAATAILGFSCTTPSYLSGPEAIAEYLSKPRTASEPMVWVYEHQDFGGRVLAFSPGHDYCHWHPMDFGDKASSVKWENIPDWQRFHMFEDSNCGGRSLALTGSGAYPNLKDVRHPDGGNWGDRISGSRWIPPRRAQ